MINPTWNFDNITQRPVLRTEEHAPTKVLDRTVPRRVDDGLEALTRDRVQHICFDRFTVTPVSPARPVPLQKAPKDFRRIIFQELPQHRKSLAKTQTARKPAQQRVTSAQWPHGAVSTGALCKFGLCLLPRCYRGENQTSGPPSSVGRQEAALASCPRPPHVARF